MCMLRLPGCQAAAMNQAGLLQDSESTRRSQVQWLPVHLLIVVWPGSCVLFDLMF